MNIFYISPDSGPKWATEVNTPFQTKTAQKPFPLGTDCFHMTSRRPYWELNSFLMQTPSSVPEKALRG